MASFAKRIPRLPILAFLLAAFCLVPLEVLAEGPDLCLWRNLFHLSCCPACGSTRALAAFFHGRFAEALEFNSNVVVTAPLLLSLLIADICRVVLDSGRRLCTRWNLRATLVKFSTPSETPSCFR